MTIPILAGLLGAMYAAPAIAEPLTAPAVLRDSRKTDSLRRTGVASFYQVSSGSALSQGERDRAMSYLHATRKQFLDIVTTATDEQWAYKPSPERWSLAEVAEHITLSEDMIYKMTLKIAEGPAAAGGKKSTVKDEAIVEKLTDRSAKAQAPEPLKPSHRWKTREALITEFKQWRDRTIEYAEKTPVDLRAHLSPHPLFGAIDAYQWLLLIAGHSERHILQMREVMASEGFPKAAAGRK